MWRFRESECYMQYGINSLALVGGRYSIFSYIYSHSILTISRMLLTFHLCKDRILLCKIEFG
jgi:hypothetical protein